MTVSEAIVDEWRKKATPAHLAQYATRELPPETQWKPYHHHLYLNDLLVEACTSPEQTFLNIAASVRSGKSELISRYLVVWFLGLFPDKQVIIVSYSAEKATEWGVATRELFRHWGPELFGLTLDPDTASKADWKIKGRRGGCRAVGVNGALTGIGGDLIIIDDPVKNREEGDSPVAREAMWSWYGSTLRTRLMPGGTMILTMARWHEDDLTGRIEKKSTEPGGDPWTFVRLPALAEAPKGAPEDWTDDLGRKDGEALWPDVWTKAMLEQIRASIGAADWESLYQQNPTPREGGMFKVDDWREVTHVDRSNLRLVRCWDLAATENGGDWSVGVLMGMSPTNEVFILDIQRFRKNWSGVKEQIRSIAAIDTKSILIRVEQEKAGAGKAQIQELTRWMVGYNLKGEKPDGTKEQRLAPLAAQQQSNNVFVLTSIPEKVRERLVEEARVFPRGKYDDIIDACAGAFDELSGNAPTTITHPSDLAGHLSPEVLLTAGFGRGRPELSIPVG